MDINDTIAALSTTPGTSGVAVVKISGPDSYAIAKKLFFPKNKIDSWPRRRFIYGNLVARDKEIIDEALACYMPGPHSYTRQDVVEIQTHGGISAASATLDALSDLGVRMAEPGEFTRRAFLLGRIDLAQAEAILDIISAQTKAGLIAAQRQLLGALSGKINTLRNELWETKALLEVNIDFPEEEIGSLDVVNIEKGLKSVTKSLERLLATYGSGRLYKEGAVCVIAGRPNVGKSSLLNMLLDRRRAIVTETPGTTRDAIKATANINGIPFRLVDTAGIRKANDPIETEGVKITLEEIEKADLIMLLCDAFFGVTKEDIEIMKDLGDKNILFLINKIDLVDESSLKKTASMFSADALFISAKTGEGIKELQKTMHRAVGGGTMAKDEAVLTNARHRQSIKKGLAFLQSAANALDENQSPEIVALEIDDAANALGQIIGETTPDDVLNVIFSQFCIGK